MTHELTEDEKAFARAVARNGGYEAEAVADFMAVTDFILEKDGKWSHYYSSLLDMMNVFWFALEYERGRNKLAAAAPDLLAACVEALSLFDDYPECYESTGTLERLTAAIARATGDQTVTA